MTGGFFDGFAHFVVAVEIEDIVHQIESVLVVVDFGVEAGQVEAVCQVFLVDLAEVLIATRGDELARIFVSLASRILESNQAQQEDCEES